jgi:acyl dehydratase
MDGVLITNLVMNTAQGHFNEHLMADREFGRRIVFGGVTAAMVVGLAAQDTAENALAELGMTGVRFRRPVFHGDTLYTISEVIGVQDAERPDAGVVTFAHTGHNQRDEVVFTGQRRVLLKRASHWAGR